MLRGRDGQRGIAFAERNREHRSDQRDDLVHALGREAEHFLQLVELGFGRLLRRDPRRPLELLREGIKRAVAMIGRALVAKPGVSRVRDLLGEPGGQARFADARFARDQYGLALAAPRAALAADQFSALGLTPDEAGQSRRMRRVETALALGHAERRIGLDRLCEALDRVPAQVLQAEPVADQPPRRGAYDDAARISEALQPRGEIGRIADDRLLLRGASSDNIARDDESGRDPDPHGELFAGPGLQAPYGFGDVQSRMDRTRRIVLVRAGKAEGRQNPVAKEFRDKAVIARQHARAGVLIGMEDLTHVLGIEPGRQRGRADEIAEHDGELAPLGGVGAGRRGGRGIQRLDCGHDLAPMADGGDAEILEVVQRQFRQHRAIDGIVSERRLVLPEAKRPEPAPDVHPCVLEWAAMMVLRRRNVHSVGRSGVFAVLPRNGRTWRNLKPGSWSIRLDPGPRWTSTIRSGFGSWRGARPRVPVVRGGRRRRSISTRRKRCGVDSRARPRSKK